MDRRRRNQLRLDFTAGRLRKAIATDVWSTGVSFNGLAALVRADGRGTPILDEQIPGRLSRTNAASGKRGALLIDSDDAFDRSYAGTARKRRKNYAEKGWAQYEAGAVPARVPAAGGDDAQAES
jgi:superfamily II DNA or RNA helicase